ncbi:MAG: hypothetical protein KJP00_11615 [Bacteroidia bacterium]|nr:hypothetical protein [Bacteroidia bacterium]
MNFDFIKIFLSDGVGAIISAILLGLIRASMVDTVEITAIRIISLRTLAVDNAFGMGDMLKLKVVENSINPMN